MSNYATKPDFAKKTDLVHLKSDVDKSNIDKLNNVANNSSNLRSKVDKLDVDNLVPFLLIKVK